MYHRDLYRTIYTRKRTIYDSKIRLATLARCGARATSLSKGSCDEDRDRFLLPSRGNDRSAIDLGKYKERWTLHRVYARASYALVHPKG